MRSEQIIHQILTHFRKDFISESKTGNPDELAQLIREKMLLIENPKDKKNLLKEVINEIQEILLVEKYKVLYKTRVQTNFFTQGNYVINRLKYNFNQLI